MEISDSSQPPVVSRPASYSKLGNLLLSNVALLGGRTHTVWKYEFRNFVTRSVPLNSDPHQFQKH